MLGVCCHWLVENTNKKTGLKELVNIIPSKVLQLGAFKAGKYSEKHIHDLYIENLELLHNGIDIAVECGIRHFRISSSLFPLADKVSTELWRNNDSVLSKLKQIGDYVKHHKMRITTHPGQFTVLSSDSNSVIENSITELNIHTWLFDSLGLDRTPYYSINIHGGKSSRMQQLINVINDLPIEIKSRLTLENDETCYSVTDLLDVFTKTNIPVVWDSHHHSFNTGNMSIDDAVKYSMMTWRGIKPLQHLSNSEPHAKKTSFTEMRKHSSMIHYVPDVQLEHLRADQVDCEIEAKNKNIAVFDMAKRFSLKVA
jgi:UV DNA damage endonuclease